MIGLAVLLWYLLGVVSIASSKVLLNASGVSPVVLSFQQFLIGSIFLRLLLEFVVGTTDTDERTTTPTKATEKHLKYASLCFALGFLATNWAFFGAAASWVETLKASEPISSAALAYAWGLEEYWSVGQGTSLLGIVVGVVLATTSHPNTSTNTTSWLSVVAVLTANFCFSLRGLFQKLGQKGTHKQQQQQTQNNSHHVSKTSGDVRLQYSMQCMGVQVMILPMIVELVPRVWWNNSLTGTRTNVLTNAVYILLAIVNGIAFCSYNLASTYILSRLSVVHHAALNCLRRVFAIVVTSLLFGIPMTGRGALGIALALGGFLSYTHCKQLAVAQGKKQRNETLPLTKSNQ